jgi:hypothetical protein
LDAGKNPLKFQKGLSDGDFRVTGDFLKMFFGSELPPQVSKADF